MNKLLFDDPEIDVKSGPKEMKAVMYEALTCLRTGDTVSKETVAVLLECDFPFDATFFEQIEKEDQDDVLSVLQTLGIWVNKEDDENPAEGAEEAEEAEDIVEDTKEYSLEEEIDDAQSMKVLKDIVKVYDELKELRGTLTKYKTKEALKADMLAILGKEEAEKPAKEVEKKDAPKVEKSTAPKKKKATPAERIAFLTPLIEKGKLTQKELVEKAAAKFPEVSPSTLNTILTNGKNPKYNQFETLLKKDAEGVITFK